MVCFVVNDADPLDIWFFLRPGVDSFECDHMCGGRLRQHCGLPFQGPAARCQLSLLQFGLLSGCSFRGVLPVPGECARLDKDAVCHFPVVRLVECDVSCLACVVFVGVGREAVEVPVLLLQPVLRGLLHGDGVHPVVAGDQRLLIVELHASVLVAHAFVDLGHQLLMSQSDVQLLNDPCVSLSYVFLAVPVNSELSWYSLITSSLWMVFFAISIVG